MEKTATLKLYDEIRNGAHMGIDALDEMLKQCHDSAFAARLCDLQSAYKTIAQDAADAILAQGGLPEELSAEARWGLHAAAKARLAFSKKDEKAMARMVLKGMEAAEKELHRDGAAFQNASEEAHALADRLLELQQTHRRYFSSF